MTCDLLVEKAIHILSVMSIKTLALLFSEIGSSTLKFRESYETLNNETKQTNLREK